jgi:hypothetical protein
VTATVVVSLDFELRWGLLDVLGTDVSSYRANLEGVSEAVPRLLEVFSARGIGATWATVGALACEGWDEWMERAPKSPQYADPALRWRDEFRSTDPTGRLYFGKELVELIARTPDQELASHTFSHVYFREPGFTRNDAIADADAMVKLFRDRWNSVPRSVVFPRNQGGYEDVLAERGVTAWRDNPRTFYWSATSASEQSSSVRVLRLLDSVAPLGRRVAPSVALRSSYFVRVGLPNALWNLHRRRIVSDARQLRDDETLHLWWHPHNLGAAPAASVARIAALLDAVRDAAPDGTRFVPMAAAASVV